MRSLLKIASVLVVLCGFASAQDWPAITKAEMDMRVPRVEADANAEVLYWEVRTADEYSGRTGFRNVMSHYVRVKIFTEKGRDENSKIDLYYGKFSDQDIEISIRDIAARTTKSDGTFVELRSQDIFDKDAVKGDGIKVKAKSFVLPGVEVGSIVEYRWKEVKDNVLNFFVRLDLARDIPVQRVKYYVKQLMLPRFGMRIHSFKVTSSFQKERDGFYSLELKDIPAIKREPHMPSEYRVKPWMLIYYEDGDENATPGEYWGVAGNRTFADHSSWLNANDDVKRKAAEIVAGSANDAEKVRRIYDYCRSKIVNIWDDTSGIKPDQLKDVKENRSSADVLKTGRGYWHDIEMLCAAMLKAVGFDPRVVNVSTSTEPVFERRNGNRYFNRTEILAVRIDNEWRFLSPSSRYIPFGMLPSTVENQVALISDPKLPVFVNTPGSSPEQSLQKRTATLNLTPDGSLEGEVRMEFFGHIGAIHKERNDELGSSEREKLLIALVKKWSMDTAEVSDISISNVTDPELPFTYVFRLKLPSYAQQTGRRLLLQPNIFERGTDPKFIKGSRQYDIFFDFPWKEEDEVNIVLPNGLRSESIDQPERIADGFSNALFESKTELSTDRKSLKYSRTFTFGIKSLLNIDSSQYGVVKRLFDSVHAADTKAILFSKEPV
jgi:hypothetical protein